MAQISPEKLSAIIASVMAGQQARAACMAVVAMQQAQEAPMPVVAAQQAQDAVVALERIPSMVEPALQKSSKAKKAKKTKNTVNVHFGEMIIFYVDKKDEKGNVVFEHAQPFYRMTWKDLKKLLNKAGYDYDINRGLNEYRRTDVIKIEYQEPPPSGKKARPGMRCDEIRLFCRIEANCSNNIVDKTIEQITHEFNINVEELEKTREQSYKLMCDMFYSKLLQGFFLRRVGHPLVAHPAQVDLLDPKSRRTFPDTTDFEVIGDTFLIASCWPFKAK